MGRPSSCFVVSCTCILIRLLLLYHTTSCCFSCCGFYRKRCQENDQTISSRTQRTEPKRGTPGWSGTGAESYRAVRYNTVVAHRGTEMELMGNCGTLREPNCIDRNVSTPSTQKTTSKSFNSLDPHGSGARRRSSMFQCKMTGSRTTRCACDRSAAAEQSFSNRREGGCK